MDKRGEKLENSIQLSKEIGSFFLEGNIKVLSEYFQLACEKLWVNIAFIGSHIYNDIYAIHNWNEKQKVKGINWDVIATTQLL
jgi:hypothetical protein